MAALLEEKLGAETRAAEAEKRLGEACAAASRAEAKVSALEAELSAAISEHTTDTMDHAREQGATIEKARMEAFQVRCLLISLSRRPHTL